ncbi:hypothetical protein HAX54_037996 [Datura stramonium]|uniref:Uncharacterized protein n=1 Tax=Datura stramonium TaxID=4076 RepID=A0ABS8VKN7_DATST|nr:hypothetical protein [Datura stramonium]
MNMQPRSSSERKKEATANQGQVAYISCHGTDSVGHSHTIIAKFHDESNPIAKGKTQLYTLEGTLFEDLPYKSELVDTLEPTRDRVATLSTLPAIEASTIVAPMAALTTV